MKNKRSVALAMVLLFLAALLPWSADARDFMNYDIQNLVVKSTDL